MPSFLTPAFLIGAAAAAVPLILHLLKREPEPRVRFAAVKLLKNAPVELTEKRHLRELLLLALRIAALVLLALAFARPFFASRDALGSSATTIVALDTSYSLSAPGRMDRARQLAKSAVSRAPAGARIGVVTFSDEADLAVKPTADRALAISAIDAATPGFGATRYRTGLDRAAQALGGARGTIVVVTDLQESGWDAGDRAAVPESAEIQIADVGPLPPNLSVTSVRAIADRIVASVRSTDTRPRETRVHLKLDGRPTAEITVSVGANSSTDVALAPARNAATAEVSVDDSEGLQADNVRYAILDGANQPSVLVVTSTGDPGRDAFYVQQALSAGGSYQVTGASAARLNGADDLTLTDHAAVLLVSTRGLERRGRERLASYVRSGGGVVIAVGPDVDGEVAADVLGSTAPLRIVLPAPDARPALRTVAPADVRHPIFQPFGANAASLGLVRFRSVARVSGADCQPLARFTTGESAILDCAAGEGRGLVIASDLNNRWNDFPLHPTYVPFLHEAVRYLSNARSHANEYLVGDAPAGLAHTPGIAVVPDERRGTSVRPRRVAVNVDPREAEPGRVSMEDFQAAVGRLKDVGRSEARVAAAEQEERQHIWQYVLALMIVALAAEGVVASRTG